MIRKLLTAAGLIFAGALVFANEGSVSPEAATSSVAGIKYLSAAIAVGIACIAGGMAVGRIGAAAMGAMSENAELSGKALPFVGLAEGICLWGFLVALLILLF
ncbi:MAG TPA: ATPase [Treponema sp.]|nr:ATPase [Treponema sp.]